MFYDILHWVSRLSLVLFWLTFALLHLFCLTVATGDGAQTGRNHADDLRRKPGSAVQRHPEWSPNRKGDLQPPGGPVHQCWTVRWHYLCPHLSSPTSHSQASVFWDSTSLFVHGWCDGEDWVQPWNSLSASVKPAKVLVKHSLSI